MWVQFVGNIWMSVMFSITATIQELPKWQAALPNLTLFKVYAFI
jgi:hypothetical protein